MTRNLNELTFIGNVGSQPELRHTQTSNKAVTDFFLAITENWKNQAGEIESETTWVKVVCWDNTAESVAKVINKGDLVFIRGKLRIKTIEKDGVKFQKVEAHAQNVLKMSSPKEKPEETEDK